MSLLENKNNNTGIKQLNQISEFNENYNNNNSNNNNLQTNINETENEEEEEEEDEDENNISEKENNEGNEENEEEEEIDEENLSLLSLYKYKLNYDDRINIYPRPNNIFLIYKNSNSENIFTSYSNNIEVIPSVKSYFINIEESNSSIKLIRPSQYIIPNNIKKLYNTLNIFGLNIEPFALDDKENSFEYIQKINVKFNNKNDKILKCGNCNAFYHKLNFNLELISDNKYYHIYKYFCFICKKHEEYYNIEPEGYYQNMNNIDINKIFVVPDNNIYKPSIEYIIEDENNINIIRTTIQIIILDLSNKNLVNFIYKLLNEKLKEKEKEINKSENIINYVLIAYYFDKIYFIYLNKLNSNICISIMNDLKNPFCPIEPHKLFYSSNDFLELFGQFFNSFYLNKIESTKDNNSSCNSDINNSIIKSILNLIKANKINEDNKNNKYYYHLIFFSSLNHNINTDLFKENKINNIFLSFFLVSIKRNKNIPFIDNLNIHNIKLYYFPIDYKDEDDIIQKHQKMNIIIDKLLNINNYIYDIKLNICYDKKIFKNNNNTDIIYISFIPNKISLNKIYILPQIGNPSIYSGIHIQYNIEYYSFSDKYKHIRILTFMNKVSNNLLEIYKSYDEEILFRILLAYHLIELNLNKNSINKLYIDIINKKDKIFLKIIKNITNKIKKTFAKYFKDGTEKKGIFIPLSLKLFSLYFFSFIKQISSGHNLNLLNILYDCKIKTFMKMIYPNLINLKYKSKLNKEIFNIRPLSLEYFENTQLLLYDDGLYITILINSDIKDSTKEHYIKKIDDKEYFKVESLVINDIIKNKPIRIVILSDNMISNKNFLNIFLEDKIIENINNEINNETQIQLNNEYIQNDLNYSDYYEILTRDLYEFFD